MKRFDSRPNAWNEFLGRFLRSWPWWALMIVAGVATAIGVVILVLPQAALSRLVLVTALGFIVSGIADLTGAEVQPRAAVTRWIGVAWIVFGVAVLIWSDEPAVIVVVSAALFAVSGVVRTVAALLRRPRVIGPILTGVVEMAIAVGLVLSPHTTFAVVALAYGIRTTIAGVHLGVVADSVRRRRSEQP